jgi:acetyl esterase/lipase
MTAVVWTSNQEDILDGVRKISRHLVDPDVLKVVEAFSSTALTDDRVRAIRAEGISPGNAIEAGVTVKEYSVPVPGAPDRRLLILAPDDIQSDAPCLFFVHGGGYVMGGPEHGFPIGSKLAKACRCVVVLPTYRLAPEARWPAPVDDLYAQLCWIGAKADSLGIDGRKIVVGGHSAGGGHAARLVLRARDSGGPAIIFQLLIYPMIDDRQSQNLFAGEYVWTRQDDRYGWDSLLGLPSGGEGAPEEAVPGRVRDLANLPPTYISAGELDLFAEANLDFARRLMASGVSTEIHVFPGGVHGFDYFSPEASISKRAIAELQPVLTAAFARAERRETQKTAERC